jgi:pimeloyl-ACP methyl ester carboxylesterase
MTTPRAGGKLATFMSAVSGLEWEACRALLEERIPGAVAQTIADADTFFGVELPALSAWTFGAEQAARVSQPVLSVVGGETEPLWVEVTDRLRSWFGPVEECTIEGVGHLLHIQRSAPVAACLAAFFGGHALAARSTSPVAAEAQV